MECPKCQLEIPDNSKFCNECGCHLVGGLNVAEIPRVMDSERKLVTIMFSDMSGYTAMTEHLDPEEVKGIMSQIFGKITEIIKKYDGFIERFIGDAVMAVFGVPKAHEDDPIRAIKAAIEIHSAVEGFSPQFEDQIGHSLTMHTGINTGLVVTGEVDIQKGTHGLTGDAINLASRIEGLAKSDEIMVGESTYQLVRQYFEFQSTEPTQVKGKAKPVSVYKLISAYDQQTIAQRLQGVQSKLIGRETEMNLLGDSLENLKQGKGSIISIIGHAGTGKSRLIQEFKARIKPGEVQWREGHAYAYTQNIAYYPLTNLLTHAFQIREGDNPDIIREKVEIGVKELLWDNPEAKKYLGGLFSLTYADVDEISPEFWRQEFSRSVQQLLEALASRGPTVILFEDLHWTDVAFIELLHLLFENIQRPVMFLCVYRPSFSLFPEEESDSLNWPHHKIELRDLTWEQTQDMLQSLLDSNLLPDDLRYFIKQKVEGNPFYLEEVINSLIETGVLKSENGDWKLTQPIDLEDVPPTIQGVLTARLDRLEKETKRILQEASVIGRAFFYEVLTRVTELSTPVDNCLLGLESLDLIRTRSREPDLEYIFKHALTQEVVYNGLLIKERQDIHERIGTVIEQLFQNRLPEFYETLAFHFTQGKSAGKAVEYLIKAGEKSLNRFALGESTLHFKEAFDIILSQPKRTDADNLILIDILNRWAKVHYYRGSFVELESLLLSQENIVENLGTNTQCGMFYAWLGMSLWANGQSKSSYNYLQKAKSIGETVNNKMIIGYACIWLSFTCADLGSFDEGISFAQEGHKIAGEIKTDHYLYFKSLFAFSYNYAWMGNPAPLKPIVKELIEYGEQHSHVRCLVVAYWSEGHMHASVGDWGEVIRSYQKAIEVAVDPFYHFASQLVTALRLLQAGMIDELEAILPDILKYCDETDNRFFNDAIDSMSAVLQIIKGDLSIGMQKLMAIETKTKDSDFWFQAITIEIMIAQVYLKAAKKSQPISFLTMIKNPGFILKHVFFAAQKAEKHLKKIVSMGAQKDAIGLVAQANLELGILYKHQKRYNEAHQNLNEAIQIFNEIGASIFLDQAKDELAGLP